MAFNLARTALDNPALAKRHRRISRGYNSIHLKLDAFTAPAHIVHITQSKRFWRRFSRPFWPHRLSTDAYAARPRVLYGLHLGIHNWNVIVRPGHTRIPPRLCSSECRRCKAIACLPTRHVNS